MSTSPTDIPDNRPNDVRATEAAAEFIAAVARFRSGTTTIPPKGLAEWLRQNPHLLHGDAGLPTNIDSVAEAFEYLPGAVLNMEPPRGYQGNADDFMFDAAKAFKNVAERLDRVLSAL